MKWRHELLRIHRPQNCRESSIPACDPLQASRQSDLALKTPYKDLIWHWWMTSQWEGHPPPSAKMARSGWRSSFVIVPTLLRTKMEFERSRLRSRRMKTVEIRRRGPSAEIGVIRPEKCHGKSWMNIPFTTCQVMYGCREFGRYRLNFPARSLHSHGPLI